MLLQDARHARTGIAHQLAGQRAHGLHRTVRIEQALELCKGFLAQMADAEVKPPSTSREQVDQALAELASILSSHRIASTELLDKVRAAQDCGASRVVLEKLIQETGMFQYEEALVTLEVIRTELDSKR